MFLVISPPIFFCLALKHLTLAKDCFFADCFTKVVSNSYSIGPERPSTRYKNVFFANQKIFVKVSPISEQRGHFMVS